MALQDLVTNKEFMDRFIAAANRSFKRNGTYEDVYYTYDDRMSDDDIRGLLYHCEENGLLEY